MRFRISMARPIGADRYRFITGPSSAAILEITNCSSVQVPSRVAFATALFKTLETGRQAPLGVYFSTACACVTSIPRISRATNRTFRVEVGMNLPFARAIMA